MLQTGSLNLAMCPELATNQFFKLYAFQFSAYTLSVDHQRYIYSWWDLICPDIPKKIKWLWRSTLTIFSKWSTYIVCMPFSAEGLSLLPNFQKRCPDRISIFRGRFLEKMGWLFWAGEGRDRSLYIKNKLKSGILNDKKTANQNAYVP